MKITILILCLFFTSELLSQTDFSRLKIDTVFVKGGSFSMGSPEKEKYRSDDEIPHTVTVSDFFISKTEVTCANYIQFMNTLGVEPNGSFKGTEYVDMDDPECCVAFKDGKFIFSSNYLIKYDVFPMTQVTWAGAVAFAKWVGGRLPTESEWEYAAKGGNLSNGFAYAGSDNAREVAIYIGTAKRIMHPLATMKVNELGLFDMSGSVWEWCSDWYKPYEINNQKNSSSTNSGKFRVIRGGCWNSYAEDCRVAYRGSRNPTASGNDCGFRVVFDR